MLGNKKAFTLAEVLITLAVIGVVAAISIPSLMVSMENRQNKAALKKSYAVLEQATRRILSDLGGTFVGTLNNDTTVLTNLYAKYLNVTKRCAGGEDCGIIPRHKVDGSSTSDFGTTQVKLFLADGALLSFTSYDCNQPIDGISGRDLVCGKIMIDVNGEKPPNVTSKDVFRVWIQNEKILPSGSSLLTNEGYPGCGCSSTYCGYTCTAQYLLE